MRFVDLTLNGVANGAIFAAVALSLVLIWRATRILNFAQAGMLMLTTFIAWALIDKGAPYVVGFVVALLAGLLPGAAGERVGGGAVGGGPPLDAGVVTRRVRVVGGPRPGRGGGGGGGGAEGGGPAAERGDRHARAARAARGRGRDDLGRQPEVVPAGVLDPGLQDRRSRRAVLAVRPVHGDR